MDVGTNHDLKVGAFTFFGTAAVGFASALAYLVYPFEVIAPFIL